MVHKAFLCPEDTLFDQTIVKCNWWFYVDCASSPSIYDSNIPISKSYQLMKSLTYFSSFNKQADNNEGAPNSRGDGSQKDSSSGSNSDGDKSNNIRSKSMMSPLLESGLSLRGDSQDLQDTFLPILYHQGSKVNEKMRQHTIKPKQDIAESPKSKSIRIVTISPISTSSSTAATSVDESSGSDKHEISRV